MRNFSTEKLVKKCVAFNIHLMLLLTLCVLLKDGKIRFLLNFYDKCSAFCDLFCSTDRYQRTIVKTHKNTCKKNRSSTSQNDIFLLPIFPFTSILCFMKFLSQFSLFYRLLTINCLCCFSFLQYTHSLFPKKNIIYI